MRLICLFLLTSSLFHANAQDTKDMLQGTWHLTSTRTELYNSCTYEVSEHFTQILVFKNDTLLRIFPWRSKPNDTTLYVWEIEDEKIRLWLPNLHRKKQPPKYISISSLTNFKLTTSQSLYDRTSVINSFIDVSMTFTKENKSEKYMLGRMFFGDWFITDKQINTFEDLINTPVIKLQRDTHYLDTTSELNPCNDTTHNFLHYRFLSISDIGVAAIDFNYNTLIVTPPPCTRRAYEASMYTKSIPIDHKYSYTITVFHRRRELRFSPEYGPSTLFKFDRLGDTLILIKK